MCARNAADLRSTGSRTAAVLTWLGGGERRELDERHERSAHVIAGVIVILTAALTCVVTTLAVAPATGRSTLFIALFALVFGLLVGAITRAIAGGPIRGLGGIAGRSLVAVAAGTIVAEFAALAMFSGSIDRHLELQAAHNADSAPAVVQASTSLAQTRNARVALDNDVDGARIHRDEALVVARCEYHPTPSCPQTRITGVPGSGPETRTANQLLADAQQELDTAVVARGRRTPELDAQIRSGELELGRARQTAIADADHGFGARWVAMQQLTSSSAGTLILRLLAIAFFTLLSLLPLMLRLWRGETAYDRHAKARAERERAEVKADTAIAVKRAEVRAAAESMWAEQQLAQARLAVEAQTEIDRAQLRHRVNAAIEDTTRDSGPIADEIKTENLPAVVGPRDTPAAQAIPSIPDVTRAAARWIRPLVPSFVARAIDTSTHPVRTMRQVIEEVEEITFSLKRTHRIIVEAEDSAGMPPAHRSAAIAAEDDQEDGDFSASAAAAQTFSLPRLSAERADDNSSVSGRREPQRELTERDGPAEIRAAHGPRQLPPAE